jgi:xanthine dehydrogenase YagS FAD-binding subunit
MEYSRPASLDEALKLMRSDGAHAFAGGTDLVGQMDRGLAAPELIIDLQALDLGEVRADGDGVLIGATTTISELARSSALAPYAVVRTAASQVASPLLRNAGTVGGNLCQRTRCWYFRGYEWNCWLGGGDTCYAQVGEHPKHGLQPGDCISAHPSDMAPALAACGARVLIASDTGTREIDVLDLYKRPLPENRSLLTLAPGELVTGVRLPSPPDASAYERVGERRAFSFPLVAVAAARRGEDVRVVAGGVANIPVELDPAEPLRDLPGNPQSAWKRRVVETLTARALAAVE